MEVYSNFCRAARTAVVRYRQLFTVLIMLDYITQIQPSEKL